MSENYERFLISNSYQHWWLYLHKNQFPYLWRSYAWAKRPDADLVTDATSEEIMELFWTVIPQWQNAVSKLYQDLWVDQFRPNVAIMWNEAPHLHAHLIPRFNKPLNYWGHTFVDPNPKWNYAPYPKRPLSEEILLSIKTDLKRFLI